MLSRLISAGTLAAAMLLAGCATSLTGAASNDVFAVTADSTHATTAQAVQLHANLDSGGEAEVRWSVRADDSGQDVGQVSATGLFTPPAFLAQNMLRVEVTATLASNPSLEASYVIAVHPAISITPENVALAPGAETTLYATLAETGGGKLNWNAARSPGGAPLTAAVYGRFSGARCRTSPEQFTQCSVTYTAPDALPQGADTLIYAQAADQANPAAFTGTRVLLNSSALASPIDNQVMQTGNDALGSSGGNSNDSAGQYCCGGTLGSLLHIGNSDFILSNNHVLARTDSATPGEQISQPGLTDTQCGYDPSYAIATLSYAPRLRDDAVNVDAAIARAEPGAVRADGGILGLGASSTAASMAIAAPAADPEDITTAGRPLPLLAKSGRSTGLTCAPVSDIAVDVKVDYNTACDGSGDGFTKVFHNQIAVSGAAFSDTGDSGALVVDRATAQPVGMLFAGNAAETFLNPIGDVLAALRPYAAEHGNGAVSFAGGEHHAVTCLDYDALAAHMEPPAPLKPGEQQRGDAALSAVLSGSSALSSITLPANAYFSVSGSRDAPGEAALTLHVPEGETAPALPVSADGVRTATARTPTAATAAATASATGSEAASAADDLSAVSRVRVDSAILVKDRYSSQFLADPAVLGIGVTRSRDNPDDAAIVVYLKSGQQARYAPAVLDGFRVAYRASDAPRAFHWKQRDELTPPVAARSCIRPNAVR